MGVCLEILYFSNAAVPGPRSRDPGPRLCPEMGAIDKKGNVPLYLVKMTVIN